MSGLERVDSRVGAVDNTCGRQYMFFAMQRYVTNTYFHILLSNFY